MNLHFVMFGVILLFLGPVLRCEGQSPGAMKHYGVREGLPSEEVYHILPDSRGFLWFSTDHGVGRYDGKEFRTFSLRDGLVDNTVFRCHEDKKGRVWMLSFAPELCYFHEGRVQAFKGNEAIRRAGIKPAVKLGMASYPPGGVTVGTIGRGWYSVDQDGQVTQSNWQKHPNILVLNGEFVPSNQFGFGIPVEKFKLGTDLRVIREELSPPNKGSTGRRMYGSVTANGTLIFSTGNNLLVRQADGTLRTFTFPNLIDCIMMDGEDFLWLGFRKRGAWRLKWPLSGTEPLERYLNGRTVSHIARDFEGGMWFSTIDEGVYYSPAPGGIVESGASVPAKEVSSLCANKAGGAYVSFADGELGRIDSSGVYEKLEGKKEWVNAQRRQPLIRDQSTGEIWSLSRMEAVLSREVLSGNLMKTKEEREIMLSRIHSSEEVQAVASRKGGFYLMNRAGLFYLRGTEMEVLIRNSKANWMDDLFEDSSGALWFCGPSGLHRYAKGKLTHFAELHPYGSLRIDAIEEVKGGGLLLALRGIGLAWWRKREVRLITEAGGLSSMLVTDILARPEGGIWVATERGLNLMEFGKGGSIKIRVIGEAIGLEPEQIRALSPDGERLWVGTDRGVRQVFPDLLPPDSLPPGLQLEGLRINGRDTVLRTHYVLRPGQNYLSFSFLGLSYRNSAGISYEYQLEGLDEDWQRSRKPEAKYNALSPGSYVFRVRALFPNGLRSEEAKIGLVIQAPFWQRMPFWGLCLLLLIGMGLAGMRWRESRLREQNEQQRKLVELELKALRAQMNPHFTFNTLNSIQEIISQGDRLAANAYLAEFARLIRRILDNSRHNTISLEEELETLELYLKLEKRRFKSGLTYSIAVDPDCDVSAVRVPPLIIQPFVENAIVHGIRPLNGAGEVRVSLKEEGGSLVCRVEDNGIGREASAILQEGQPGLGASMGIRLSRERLELMNLNSGGGWKLQIVDLKNPEGGAGGTRVKIWIPLKRT